MSKREEHFGTYLPHVSIMIQSKVISKNVSHNISQGMVRAAESDLDQGWRSQSLRMAMTLGDAVICHSPLMLYAIPANFIVLSPFHREIFAF